MKDQNLIANYTNYAVNPILLNFINLYCQSNNKKPSDVKILDYGCGIGRAVYQLRKMGFNQTYGVDINSERVVSDNKMFDLVQADRHSALSSLQNNSMPFEDNFFDIVISDQVVEHLKDLTTTFTEIKRVSSLQCQQLHLFPAKYIPLEPHLYMPIIHWLPKNSIRKAMIAMFILLGFKPPWADFKKLSFLEKINRCYSYSINSTYYRSVCNINSSLSFIGLKTEIINDSHPKLKWLYKMKNKILHSAIIFFLTNFRSVHLQVIKTN